MKMEGNKDSRMDIATSKDDDIGFISNLLSTWRVEEVEVKEIYPGRCTLQSESCHLFNQDTLKIEDFNSSGAVNKLFNLSQSELWETICRSQLKRSYSSETVRSSVCWYLFYLTSVHKNEEVCHFSSKTLQLIKNNWYPNIESIFLVFINWGINSELLDMKDIEISENISVKFTSTLPPGPRIDFHNILKFLPIIHSVATPLAQNTAEDKFNKLLQLLVLLSLDEGLPKNKGLWAAFSKSIEALVNAIPKKKWNKRTVFSICKVLHRDGKEHFHNQKEVCNRLLTFIPRGNEIALTLAYMTLSHLLATELRVEPITNFDSISTIDIITYYGVTHRLKFYPFYVIIGLIRFCTLKEDYGGALSMEYLQTMNKWLERLKSPTILGCVDHMRLLTQIDVTMSLFKTLIMHKKELAQQNEMCDE